MSRKLCKGLALEPWKTVNTVHVYLTAFALIKDLESQQSDVSKALETSAIHCHIEPLITLVCTCLSYLGVHVAEAWLRC